MLEKMCNMLNIPFPTSMQTKEDAPTPATNGNAVDDFDTIINKIRGQAKQIEQQIQEITKAGKISQIDRTIVEEKERSIAELGKLIKTAIKEQQDIQLQKNMHDIQAAKENEKKRLARRYAQSGLNEFEDSIDSIDKIRKL